LATLQSNARKTFRVIADNIGAPDQWFLDEPRCPDGLLIDAWEFTQGDCAMMDNMA
jgi:hypothetical protein